MIAAIIRWSIANRLMVILLAAFLTAGGLWSLSRTPLDAIPDLSDVQVIIKTTYPGQTPQVVEDQVTYPLTTAMLAVPGAVTVRGYSFFNDSYVYVIFEDGTDLYWARSRVLEYLSQAAPSLPEGASPALGPDATGVGWIYQYALIDRTGQHDLSQLRSIQDWFLRFELQTIEGVSEVATIGGMVRQYQVIADPDRLRAYGIPLSDVRMAIQRGNQETGGRVIEMAEAEYMVRASGYIRGEDDLRAIPVGLSDNGTPILLSDIAEIQTGPELRRGVGELNGEGEAVGGVVIMRYGENALATIERVEERLRELQNSLPDGVEIVVTYNRAGLIERAIDSLKEKLTEEFLIVIIVCAIFLFHFRSSLVVLFSLPVGILSAFIVMHMQGINANIMSLGGIAIAIGAMVDGAIVMIENAHKHLERDRGKKPHWEIIVDATKEVGPALFYSLTIIAVSFLPVFALTGQSGRMFSPLAFTKTYSMAAAALLSITIVPVLMGYLIRGRILPEAKNPINRFLVWVYRPILRWSLKWRWLVLTAAVAVLALTVVPYERLGSEFIPPLNEGDLLYMPSLLPGISITEATAVAQQTNQLIMTVPEVEHALAKVGRARTPLDPAPLEMMETTIILKPEEEWRPGMTIEKLTTELDRLVRFPGVTNAWIMPIKTRIDMLSTGIKTPIGIKITGADLGVLQRLGEQVEPVIRRLPGTRSVYAERVAGGFYIDFVIKRKEAARYGLTVDDINDVIQSAIGGRNITTTIEGLERYPVNVRYVRNLRDNPEALRRVLIATPTGAQVPLEQVASIFPRVGPPSIKTEGARPQAWIYVDINPDQDVGTYVEKAKQTVGEKVRLPPGYSIEWSGQYQYMKEARARLKVVLPVTLLIIFLLLYLNFRNMAEVLIVMLALPFAVVGGVWYMYLLGYNMSVAVMVGFIALAGVAAETGVVMIIYLDHAYEAKQREKSRVTARDLYDAIMEGAVERVRPKMMTVSAIIAGLVPIMWSTETGSRVMKRIAAPMIGGMVSSAVLTLIIIPIIYQLWRTWEMRRAAKGGRAEGARLAPRCRDSLDEP